MKTNKIILQAITVIAVFFVFSSCNLFSKKKSDSSSGGDGAQAQAEAGLLAIGSEIIDSLGSELSSSGLNDTQVTTITNGAHSELTGQVGQLALEGAGAQLTGEQKKPVALVTPVIIAGALKTLDEDDAGLAANLRSAVAGTIMKGTFKALNGKISELSNEEMISLSKSMISSAVQNLAEAGIGENDMAAACKEVVSNAVSNLDEAGFSSDAIKSSVSEISSSAVSELASLNMTEEMIFDAVQSIAAGAVSSLDECGLLEGDYAALAGEIASDSLQTLVDANIFDLETIINNDVAGYITAGAVDGLSETGMSEEEVIAATNEINADTVSTFNEYVADGTLSEEQLVSLSSAVMEGSLGSLADQGVEINQDLVSSMTEAIENQFTEDGITVDTTNLEQNLDEAVQNVVAQYNQPGAFSITGPALAVNNQTPAITWEASSDATAYDLIISSDANCSTVVQNYNDLTDISQTLTDLTDGTYYICVSAKNPAYSTPASNNSYSFTVDISSPTVEITSDEAVLVQTSYLDITITFSEDVSGFELSDITLSGATPNHFDEITANRVYRVCLSASENPSNITVNIAAGVASDLAGNGNAAAKEFAIRYDPTPLTVVSITSTESDPTNASPIPIIITFSEEVYNFEASGITVTNASVGNLQTSDNIIFTADLTPESEAAVTVDIPEGVVHDALTRKKANTAATQFAITYSTIY